MLTDRVASLQHFLREHDVEELFVGGFATDDAVLHTVLDCRAQLPDIDVVVLEDLCAAASEEAGRVRVSCHLQSHSLRLRASS